MKLSRAPQFLIRVIKKLLSYTRPSSNPIPESSILPQRILEKRIIEHGIPRSIDFNFESMKHATLGFTDQMACDTDKLSYKFCESSTTASLYSSIYVLLIYGLYGEVNNWSEDKKDQWAAYLNSFQSKEDGLYYDQNIANEHYADSDWWGARHLVLHIINAFVLLERKPKYEFHFLDRFKNIDYLSDWLNNVDWNQRFTHENDIDNKLMNVTFALQYQRDYFQDQKAGDAVKHIQDVLFQKRNMKTGMWGDFDLKNKDDLSRMVQFAYHLFPIFTYDGIEIEHKETILDHVLETQNSYGGFGVNLNSSACEDIDSIDLLIKLSNGSQHRKKEIELALQRAMIFVLGNQNDDGGFVFRRDEPLWYGHDQMYSLTNQSSLFPTWFRTLSLANLVNRFHATPVYHITRHPGYF